LAGRAVVFLTRLFVCLFVCFYQTCGYGILKTIEPILKPVNTSGPRGNDIKRSTLVVTRSTV